MGDYWKIVLESYKKYKKPNTVLAFWRSDKNRQPCNGGTVLSIKNIHTAPGGNLCTSGLLHADLNPHVWAGERLWLVRLSGTIIRDGTKLGATIREIVKEIK